jgi:ATP-dependent helicase HrpB
VGLNVEFQNFWHKIKFIEKYCNQGEAVDQWKVFLNPENLALRCEDFLQQLCYEKNSLKDLKDLPWLDYFDLNLEPEYKKFLQKEVPDHLQLPNGKNFKIHYTLEQGASVHVRLQEVMGWRNPPKIMPTSHHDSHSETMGLPLTFYLLAPNQRPVQITKNLSDFWQGSYKEIRKEMKARYPKHSWPEF